VIYYTRPDRCQPERKKEIGKETVKKVVAMIP
jgi:hypothetical protein